MTKGIRHRNVFLALALAVLTGAFLSGRGVLIKSAHAQSPLTSIIVELRTDPVVVAKARAAAAGHGFDAGAHRQQVIAEQQSFLQRLTSSLGIDMDVQLLDAAGRVLNSSGTGSANERAASPVEPNRNYIYRVIGWAGSRRTLAFGAISICWSTRPRRLEHPGVGLAQAAESHRRQAEP